MQKIIITIAVALVVTSTVFAQNDAKNYVELRGSKEYQYADYTRNIIGKLVGEVTFIRVPGQKQILAGLGCSVKNGDIGSTNFMLYGVGGSNGQVGVMAAVVPSIQKGKLKSSAFLGWFVPARGQVQTYLVLDTWDTTLSITKRIDVGSSIGFFLQEGKLNPQYGPMAKLNLDKWGSWAVSYRVGTGRELRFSRTFTF